MNQLKVFSVIAITTFSFVSCEKTTVGPASGVQQEIPATSASAATVSKFFTVIDLSGPNWVEYNACNGDYIHVVKGVWRIEQTVMINGSRLTVQFHSNTSNYKLLDQTTGIAYTGSYSSNETYTTDIIIGQPAQITGTLKILLTTPGKDNNGQYLVDYHATLNANGVLTVDFTNQRAGCQ
jgi:hypothetical protein